VDFATNPIDRARIAYRSVGTGPPIVMVHGTAMTQAVWRGFGYLRDFAVDHTVITLDLRGHGRSDKPHEPSAYSAELFVADVLAVLDELAVDRAHYLGYSLGGRVGYSLAAEYPERMLSFTSAGGAPRIGHGSFDRVFFPGCVATLENRGMEGFLGAFEDHSGGTLDPVARGALAINDSLALAAYMHEAEVDPGVSDAALSRFRLPMLLLAGSRDAERLRAAQDVLRLVPHARLHVLEGATHSDMLVHSEARPTIREFLAEISLD
jgi:pimeloyl-ACP methyl ester carboxylesterase